MDNQDFNNKDVGEYSPLMWACYEGDYGKVDSLLREGASVEEKDEWGWTPLMHACCTEHNGGIISTLIAHGAEVNDADIWGVTPLMITFEHGSGNEWDLRSAKVDLDAIDNEDQTALMYACDASDISGQQLCYSGARVDIFDKKGRSTLDHALEAEQTNSDIICTIVDGLGELKTRSHENDQLLLDTLSHWVEEYVREIEESRTKKRHRWGGHPERFLLREDTYDIARDFIYDPPEGDKFNGLSPLMYACLTGNTDLVLHLCSNKGTFFSPKFSDDSCSREYQERMEKLAKECQERDDYLTKNPDVVRKILFGE